jgi:hypothetical protein
MTAKIRDILSSCSMAGQVYKPSCVLRVFRYFIDLRGHLFQTYFSKCKNILKLKINRIRIYVY